jgi:Pyridine nucleotide-disulphide oxidoreductase, dimerisation domain
MLKLVGRADEKLLGVSFSGASPTELIHIGLTALDHGRAIDDFIEQVFNYPTPSETYKCATPRTKGWAISPVTRYARTSRQTLASLPKS